MATTVKNATLKVTVKEEITLNGTRQDSKNVLRISDINDIFKRIISVPTSEVTLYTCHASVVQGSVFDKDNVKFARVTNLDASNFIDLRMTNENADEFVYRLYAGQSFILHSHVGSMNATEDGAAGLPNGDIVSVEAQANTAAVDVEVFVASV
tara:strand:+ start:2929 stop:3387 length:459 start_codon:yes stop_codon:yes gene_type:complete